MLLFDMKTFSAAGLIAAFALLTSSGAGAATGQVSERKTQGRGLKKGDTITIKGCLQGSLLQSTEVTGADGAPAPMGAYSFQLKGKKDVLKDLTAKHNGLVVSLTGELKTTLTDESSFSTKIGGTKVVLGGDPRTREQAMQGTSQVLPVLDVKSFAGTTITCKR
jgi:hypothetical protein